MKKILFITMAVLGLTVSAQERNAKEVYLAAEKATTQQTKEIASTVKLDDEVVSKIKTILKEKNDVLSQNADLSDERKSYLIENTIARLKSVLTETQFKELLQNEELYAKIKSTDLLSK